MISIATEQALQMIAAGWVVKYNAAEDCIQWISPNGVTSWDFRSEALDDPPFPAVEFAKRRGDITERFRVPR